MSRALIITAGVLALIVLAWQSHLTVQRMYPPLWNSADLISWLLLGSIWGMRQRWSMRTISVLAGVVVAAGIVLPFALFGF